MAQLANAPEKQTQTNRPKEHPNAIPSDSLFYSKLVPGLLLILALLTGLFMIISAGIVLGFISWI